MIHKTSLKLLFIGLVACVAFLSTDAVMAQVDPPEQCTIVVSDKKGDITFVIEPVPNANDQWPYKTSADCPPLPPGETECLAAPYNITPIPDGKKFNEVLLTFPVDPSRFEFLGLNAQPSGYDFYLPCAEGSPLRSCLDSQIQVSFQTIPSGETQRLVLYFKLPEEPGDVLGTGTGDFVGGYGRDDYFCPDGIIVPSTEQCFARGAVERGAKAEVEQFLHTLVRVWRNDDGCVVDLDYCPTPDPDPLKPNECLNDNWITPTAEGQGPLVNGIEIKDCGNTIAPVGYDTPCQYECKLVVAQNPGWIWYNVFGTWYKICGGLPCGPNGTSCWDPDTKQCCSYGGSCTTCNDPNNCP